MQNDFIEIELDRKVLKQLGYEFEWKKWKKRNSKKFYLKFDFENYLAILKDGVEVTSIYIPSTYKYKGKNYKITKIGTKVFSYCAGLKEIVIPNSVIKIGKSAFRLC